MNTFGLHTFAIAPVWDLARIEPQMDRLKELGIAAAPRQGWVRTSPHFYISPEDIDTLVDALP